MRALWISSFVVLPMGCGGATPEKVAGAAVTTGLAVAAAGVHRATTGGCYAACRHGFQCEEESGQCVPIPCGGACPPNHECREVGGEHACVPMPRELPFDPSPAGGAGGRGAGGRGPGGPGAGGGGGQPPAPAAEPDACRDLCFSDETCVVVDGVADCVRR